MKDFREKIKEELKELFQANDSILEKLDKIWKMFPSEEAKATLDEIREKHVE
ncbi:MAG: hypothetical protein H8E57_04655 [Candidatus Cloacimonetes bacterium]|nr:hypothetical protein [Candidatus Cloacimonadota bacterium]